MPLPLVPILIGGGAALAGGLGVGSMIKGYQKMSNAEKISRSSSEKHKENLEKLERYNQKTSLAMDELGEFELKILNKSFKEFADLIESIHNKPVFASVEINGISLPEYNREKIEKVSLGAGVLLGGLSGAAIGTAGGFAAAGATTSAIMALGTASTGTAISTLSGVAATNATLAVIGGGTLAAGGGGIAVGSTVLGAAAGGVALLVGGVIFNIVGTKVSRQAKEAERQMLEAEKKMKEVEKYLIKLKDIAYQYKNSLEEVHSVYLRFYEDICEQVYSYRKTDWNVFSKEERKEIENMVLLVGLLYDMCKVNLVIQSSKEDGINQINLEQINDIMNVQSSVLKNISTREGEMNNGI